MEVSNGFCASFDSVFVEVLPTPFITAGPDVEICKGESGQLDGWPEGQIFYWTPSAYLDTPNFLHPLASPPITTEYTFTTVDSNGCQNSDNALVIVFDLPPVPEIYQNGGTLTTIAGYDYQWQLNGNNIADATSLSFTPGGNGNYSVIITDTNGCSNQSDVFVYSLGMKKRLPNWLKVYPNPSAGNIYLEVDQTVSGAEVFLSDISGKILMQSQIEKTRTELDLSLYAEGFYFLHFQFSEESYVQKIQLN